MSCHVAIIVSNFLKNHFQKLYHFSKLFINILQASLLVLTIVITSVSEVIQRKGILLFLIAWRLPDFVADFVLAMTITKIFNLISFRDLSLLFIKKFITKGDLNYVKSQNNF